MCLLRLVRFHHRQICVVFNSKKCIMFMCNEPLQVKPMSSAYKSLTMQNQNTNQLQSKGCWMHTHALPLSLYSVVWCWNLSHYTICTSLLELLSWQHIRVRLLWYQNVYLFISLFFAGEKIGTKHVNNICPVNLLERLNFIIITQLLQKVMLVPWLASPNPTLLSQGLLHTLCPVSANS